VQGPGPRGTAKDRALRLLGTRWRSREELRRRLRQAGFDPEDIERALEDLERTGLVDDSRFAREVVRDQAERRLSGERGIRKALREKGIDPGLIEEALSGAGDEEDRAYRLAASRAARMSGLDAEAAYRRLLSLLLRRGFSPAVAREATRSALQEALAAAFPDGTTDQPEA